MEARSSAFRLLKPHCVRLNEAVLKFRVAKTTAGELTASLDHLWAALRDVTRAASSLDDKLADYVFFPLSSVLRERQTVPVRALELALECLRLLLQTGWKVLSNSELGVQLLILLTHLAVNGSSPNQRLHTSDDLQSIAFECIATLFGSLSRSRESRDAILQTQNIPAVGHSVTVMLEGVKDGSSSIVQICALNALQSFLVRFDDLEMLSGFFPGIVSSLSYVLTPSTKSRRNYKVLENALIALTTIVQLLLADSQWTASFAASSQSATLLPNSGFGKDVSWLRGTASQVRLALSNVLKLRHHDRKEVRNALNKLCWAVLDDCQNSLSESTVMMLETVVALNQHHQSLDRSNSLEFLLTTNSRMAELLRGNLYDWLIALSRVMMSNDISAKNRSTFHIGTSYSLLSKADVDMSVIDSVMLSTMSDSLTNAIRRPAIVGVAERSIVPENESTNIVDIPDDLNANNFSLVLTGNKHESENVTLLHTLVKRFAASTASFRVARDALECAQAAQDDDRLVHFWLAMTLLQERVSQSQHFDLDMYVDVESSTTELDSDLCEDLYTFALSILTEGTDSTTPDWRHQGLALEALAFQASRLKEEFRIELVDALYPIVHHMASQVQPLRNHAMTCLNLVATACGYPNAQELLISNVDYLVNAIGVKLSTFDLSPEAPQVLLMMVKLCDSSLLLYLEDLVDNIFEALECFHGYSTLVEMLFSVLRAMVEAGSKTAQFTITVDDRPIHKKPVAGPTTMQQVIADLKRQRAKVEKRAEADLEAAPLPVEQSQGPGLGDSNKIVTGPAEGPSIDDDADDAEPKPEEPAPLSKTYNLLQRITSLTQHYLPSSSPGVRTSLLSLLTTAIPYLSHHDDTFLPLVHTLWPVLVPRLEDKEAYVVAGVLEVLGLICEGAGDFVSSRVEGIWPSIEKIFGDLQAVIQPQSHTKIRRLESSHSSTTLRSLGAFSMRETESILHPNLQLQLSDSPLSTALILPRAADKMAMQPTQQQSSASSTALPTASTHYVPSTTLTIRAALTSFLVQLVNHVRISESMFAQIASEMLYDALVHERRSDVVEALEARNPDAVWLLMERAKGRGTADEGCEWWKRRMPQGVRGFEFVEVAV